MRGLLEARKGAPDCSAARRPRLALARRIDLPDRPAMVGRRRARAGASGKPVRSSAAAHRSAGAARMRARPLRIRMRHDAEKRAMTTRAHCSRDAAGAGGAAAPARDGPARRRAGHRALAGRHARRRQPRQRHPGADRHAGRARRQRRPGHAGLAVPRRPGVVRDDIDRVRRLRAQGIELGAARGARRAAAPTRAACSAWPTTDGEPVSAGPRDVQLSVRIAAPGVAPERLRALVEAGLPLLADARTRSQRATPVALRIEVDAG